MQLLLVDDQDLILLLLEDVLREAGHQMLTTSSWEEAIHLIDEHGLALDALVTDVRLGPDQTGWQLARRAREMNPGIAVVYISGFTEVPWETERVPGSILLRKPFPPDELLIALSTVGAGLTSFG